MSARAWPDLVRDPVGERHLVQVYRERGFLVRAVAAWVGTGLRTGGGAVLVCTPRNARDVLAKLAEDGLDVDDVRASGRLVVADADEWLAGFMRAGSPDARLFHARAREACAAVKASAAPRGELRAWGEMVDLLVKRGDPASAARLETLWNQVVDAEGIRLLCSYELDHLAPSAHTGALERACAGHSQLIAEEDHAAFERAVEEALTEVCGENDAARLRASLATRRVIPIGMSAAESVIVALQQDDPERGERVLAVVRRLLQAAPR